MFHIPSVLLLDGYKLGHPQQYPTNTEVVYSNFTPRGTHRKDGGIGGVICFGTQYMIREYLIDHFNREFFGQPKWRVVDEFHRFAKQYVGLDRTDHVAKLHDLGYLPLIVKSIPEGRFVPYRVPVVTLYNTDEDFGWLTNSLETLMSLALFLPMSSATTAFQFKTAFTKYGKLTGTPKELIQWQGHDFSMRGMGGLDAALVSGMAHLTSFTGTDTCPAMLALEHYYGADITKSLIGGSVNATEHSVMCVDGPDCERETYRRLLEDVYPTGILSIVSDTYDFWEVLTKLLPSLREVIERRDGKLVIRPDSGDPVKVLLGDPEAPFASPEHAGAVGLLHATFGGTKNAAGYIDPPACVGLIYGDSINLERQEAILSGLMKQGYSSAWVVLGIGSYTYQFVTRDTDGFAMKATWAQVNGFGRAIYKDPKTDNGLKKSARGLLRVDEVDGQLTLREDVSWAEELDGELQLVFCDGHAANLQTIDTIRERVEDELHKVV